MKIKRNRYRLLIDPNTGRDAYEHVLIVERVIGRKLPNGAVIHHVNELRNDNRNENLVVCPDRKYHALLHIRQNAMAACGNPNFRKCAYCGQYDDPKNMYMRKTVNTGWHMKCSAKYRIDRGYNSAYRKLHPLTPEQRKKYDKSYYERRKNDRRSDQRA